MRNGDAYKIKKLAQIGTPIKVIIHRFRNDYSEAEVRKFLPKVSASDTPKPVKKARKRLVAEE